MSEDSTQENDIVVSNIVVSNSGGESTTNNFAYKKLLQSLQSIPISSQATTNPADDSTEEKTESISPQSTNNTWDLSTDAQLATLLNEITNHITSRTQHVSRDIRQLQQEVNNVGVNVALVRTQFMKRSNEIFMEQVVGDDEEESMSSDEKNQNTNESTKQKNDTNNEDNDDADIARLELEEQAAINDGMEALNLFFDAKRRPQQGSLDSESGGNKNQIVESTEDDMIGDDRYYYAAAEEDMFNQRPLPFVIGSREFVESLASRGSSAEQQD